MTEKHSNHAPLPSEQILFAIWDAIDRVRNRAASPAAEQLARTALAAMLAAAPSSVQAPSPDGAGEDTRPRRPPNGAPVDRATT